MLEEARMDKKSLNRLSLQQSRTSSVDCKKSTELTHKPWPRNNNNNKKRDGPATQKNEANRRNAAQQRPIARGQGDRRPRNHNPSSSFMGGAQNSGIEESEIGSVFVPGSKKQNLNHLLNFVYTTNMPSARHHMPPTNRLVRGNPAKHKQDNDLYLRAYCQFVVREGGNYRVNLLDPDEPIKWDQVEEIVVRSTGSSECPICLGTLVAGRVGHCGHVYCWACLLHYEATHDKQPPPCPVCTAPILVKEMKPTKVVQWESPAEEVTMRLVRRLRGSMVVEIAPPRGQVTDIDDTTILPLSKLNDSPYTKLFSASKQQVFDILAREKKELEVQVLAEIDTTETVYLEQALNMLTLKEKELEAQYEKPTLEEKPEVLSPIVVEKQESTEMSNKKMDWFDVSDEGAACMEILQEKMAELNVSPNLNPEAECFIVNDINDNQTEEFPLTESPPPDEAASLLLDNTLSDIDKQNQAKYFYFYQASDGQQVFLHSLNARILNASWGVLAAAPPLIRGRVLHRETVFLNKETRKHLPYTTHLPVNCSIDIVELELKPPYVTKEALEQFKADLDCRARTRARREREEKRRERAYHRVMEGPPKPDLFSDLQFPRAECIFGSPPLPETVPLSSFAEMNPPSEVFTPPPLEQASTSAASSPRTPGLSFAKMASTSGTWRVRKTAPILPSPPSDDDEGAAPRALVLSDAIEAALRTTPSTSGKKNKKNKPKLLFATGMQHSA